ncbi:50S ribosomal protein L4 [bacterium]|nr:50S ribosomal protein L4 [bacterium]
MKLKVYDLDGKETGEEVEFPAAVFEIAPNDHAIAMAVQTELHNRRQGTHSTKSRSMVRGGGRKPWRQKGRGVARAGTIRSPLWRGGGIIFGPHPHPYHMKINKKLKRLARRSALAYKLKQDNIRILTDFNWEDGKTSNLRSLLKTLKIAEHGTLMLTGKYEPMVLRACRNSAGFSVCSAVDVSTHTIMKSRIMLMQKSAVAALTEALSK